MCVCVWLSMMHDSSKKECSYHNKKRTLVYLYRISLTRISLWLAHFTLTSPPLTDLSPPNLLLPETRALHSTCTASSPTPLVHQFEGARREERIREGGSGGIMDPPDNVEKATRAVGGSAAFSEPFANNFK